MVRNFFMLFIKIGGVDKIFENKIKYYEKNNNGTNF
jgi:hypothetical protein